MAELNKQVKYAQISKLNLIKKLSACATFRVYLAVDPITKKSYMIKNEVKLQSSMVNPNILAVEDFP